MRVGPREVLFGDAETYRLLSGVRSDFTKGPWYELARILPDQDSLFSMRDDGLRKELKAKLAPGVRSATRLFLFSYRDKSWELTCVTRKSTPVKKAPGLKLVSTSMSPSLSA